MTEAQWVEIVVTATVPSASDVAALLADEVEEAAQGVMIRGAEVVFWVAAARSERALAETRSAVARMAEAGLPVAADRVAGQPALPESEWRDTWKRYFHVIRLTRQIVVVPSWESYQPVDDDLVIDLDPGQAFGTGAHASTRLLLQEMQALRDQGARVDRFLDVGTGSGILAIAAARLWPASTGLAVDIDPLAVGATRENSQINRVDDRITCADTAPGRIEGGFDLVLANIQADVLTALGADLAMRVAPGGMLLLSGLLTHQVEALPGTWDGACEVIVGGVAETVHFVVDEPSHRAFFRDALAVERVDETGLESLAAHAFPDLLFLKGVWKGLRRFEGGYARVREALHDFLGVLDDDGAWVFTDETGRLSREEPEPGSGARVPVTNHLVQSRFTRWGLDVAPEKPDVRADGKCRRERERELNGQTLYCEWHYKVEGHTNRVHLHPPIAASDGKVIVAIFCEHLRLPGDR
jgi:ribosomal protein L11 methyltransferase